MKERLLAIVALTAILTGGVLWLVGEPGWADAAWGVGAAVVLIPLTVDTVRSLLHGDVGVDAIALVAIAGALILGEQLAGAIVALMMSGGGALEAWAAGRARRELRLLVERAPRIAHRHGAEGVEEVSVEQLVPGDLVVVRAGEIVPADATVAGSVAVVDQSALTGEPLPVTVPAGGEVRSGTSNAGNVFNARVTRPASESAYAAVVRAGTDGGERPCAVHAARRPLCGRLPPVHSRGRGPRVGGERRSRAWAGGDGRRNAVPAHPRGTDRVRRRALACGEGGGDREGCRRSRAPRIRFRGASRQDRDRHERRAGRGADRSPRNDGRGRDSRPRGIARSALGTRPCREPRQRGSGPRAHSPRADRGRREPRPGHRGPRER